MLTLICEEFASPETKQPAEGRAARPVGTGSINLGGMILPKIRLFVNPKVSLWGTWAAVL